MNKEKKLNEFISVSKQEYANLLLSKIRNNELTEITLKECKQYYPVATNLIENETFGSNCRVFNSYDNCYIVDSDYTYVINDKNVICYAYI